MTSDQDVIDLVWAELVASGLVPGREQYEVARQEITRLGSLERDPVASMVKSRTWRRSLAKFGRPYPEDDCVRILGFGRSLTEFVIAPVTLDASQHSLACHAGSLANFIVSVFDHLVDLDNTTRPLSSRDLLASMSQRKNPTLNHLTNFVRPAPVRLMTSLVGSYYGVLSKFEYLDRRTDIYNLLNHTIVRMYDAENQTLRKSRPFPTDRSLRRKASLPFVVMGLPAWLGTPHLAADRFRWHLKWLYRLGEFFGWIDDVVDRSSDREAGRPNRLVALEDHGKGGPVGYREIARRLARNGESIMNEWHEKISYSEQTTWLASEAFGTCLVSWLGGVKYVAPECSLRTATVASSKNHQG